MTLAIAIATFGLTTGFFIWLIIYLFVIHQEKGENLVGWLAKFISWSGKKAQKTATAMGIQGKVDSFVASINTEVKELLPYNLKIKWISPDIDRVAFIKNNKVIVMLKHHSNQDENLAKATLLYMNKAVIPDARPHIDQKLCEAIDLMMTKKALYSFVEAYSSLGYFIESVLRPATEHDISIKDYCTTIDVIDERGLFSRVLLKELQELGLRRAGITESGNTVFESSQFIQMLENLAKKEQGQDVDLSFIKQYIKVAIILVAKPEMISKGPKLYLDMIKKQSKRSVNTFYIFARGRRNIDFAKTIVSECEKTYPEMIKHHTEEYATKLCENIVPGYYAVFYNRKT